MNIDAINTIKQAEQFLQGTSHTSFHFLSKQECYTWLEKILNKFAYYRCNKPSKGLLRAYMTKISNYSHSQLTRLIAKHAQYGHIMCSNYVRHKFANKYILEDVLLLVQTDIVHNTLSGPATKKLFERAYNIFHQKEYKRLATISVAHIYNLRKTTVYINKRRNYSKTKSTTVAIGERRKPDSDGKPGYIRIDTVHQGDMDKQKGVYHINAVDEVTQFEVVFSVEKISEAYLIPVLKLLLKAFPFKIINFHSDNGSEYINKAVAKLLNKLLIEFTKSRARQSNDNALVEGKNAAIVRKHLGYGYISQKWADKINEFNQEYLNPYINYHRPCFYAITEKNTKGKIKKKYLYENMMTPYEKLKSLPNAEKYLKPNYSFAELDTLAHQISDYESAKRMQLAKKKLFAKIFADSPSNAS